MSGDSDLYRLLQVDPSADADVIEAAYKRLALKHHPDRNQDDPRSADQMKRINEAYRVLRNADLRAAYDGRTGARLPELDVTPHEVVLRALEPAARQISFSVQLRHVSGPAYDPSKHRIDLSLMAPWHTADVHWHWSRDTLPADVEFTLELDDGFLQPGQTFSGDIELTVAARD